MVRQGRGLHPSVDGSPEVLCPSAKHMGSGVEVIVLRALGWLCARAPHSRLDIVISMLRWHDPRTSVTWRCLLTSAYHGVQPQNSTLNQQVAWIEDFLRNNPRETVILSIKQEQEDAEQFPQLVQDALGSGMWRFDENFPTLGEVRGKGIFFSRFGKKNDGQFPNGQGLKPMSWPDNRGEGFEQDWHGTQFRIHDW